MGIISALGNVFSGTSSRGGVSEANQFVPQGTVFEGKSLVHDGSDRPTDGNSFRLVGDVDALNKAWREKMGIC